MCSSPYLDPLLLPFTILNIIYSISVLGVDKISKNLGNETTIPKYNNKVQNMRIFDKATQIVMPKSVYDLKGTFRIWVVFNLGKKG
jgi:hypothetical protein